MSWFQKTKTMVYTSIFRETLQKEVKFWSSNKYTGWEKHFMSTCYYLPNTINLSLVMHFTVVFLLWIHISLNITTFVCIRVIGPGFNVLRFPGKHWGEDGQSSFNKIKDLCLFLESVLSTACLAFWNIRLVFFTNVFLCFGASRSGIDMEINVNSTKEKLKL